MGKATKDDDDGDESSLSARISGLCFDAFGTSGNGGDVMVAQCEHYTYDAHVIEFMEACYARCNCWTNLPSQGGEIYKEVDAVCIHDKCYCVFAEEDERSTTCNHAFMKTDPYCCTRNFHENCDNAVCDTDGNCHHEPKAWAKLI